MTTNVKSDRSEKTMLLEHACIAINMKDGSCSIVDLTEIKECDEYHFDLAELTTLLSNAPGVIVQDDPAQQLYPMPLWAHEKDEVFVGRLRRDETQPKTLNMWIVSDNLRKGAATNAVQIAEYLLEKGLL